MPFLPNPPLQPLRIPAGWHADYNEFFDVEPDHTAEAFSGSWLYFKEDMLQLTHPEWRLLLDLGWYPEFQPEGSFLLQLIQLMDDVEQMPEAWWHPLATYRSLSRHTIVAMIEAWLLEPPSKVRT